MWIVLKKITYLDNLLSGKHSNTVLFSFCILEVLLVILFVPLSFQTNDDVAMNSIASGAISGKPSEFLVFTNVLIGYILKFLYQIIPSVNWYTYYLILAFTGGYYALQLAFQKTCKNCKYLSITVHIAILAILIPSLVNIQFTKIAAIALAGGFSLLLSVNNYDYKTIIKAFLLIMLGAAIRVNVFYLYLLLCIPFFLFHLVKKDYIKPILLIGATVITLLIIFINHSVYNNNTEYKEYMYFNSLRSKITEVDNPTQSYEKNKQALDELNWNYADYYLATNFMLDLGHSKFTINNIEYILNARNHNNILNVNINKILIGIKATIITFLFHSKKHLLYYSIPVFFIFLTICKRRFKPLLQIFFYSAYLLVITSSIIFLINGSLKEHLVWSILLVWSLFVIFTYNSATNNNDGKIKIRVTKFTKLSYILISLMAIITIVKYSYSQNFIKDYRLIERDNDVYEFLEKQPDQLYVSWCNLTNYNLFDLPFSREKVYTLGWFAGNPLNKEKLNRYAENEISGLYSIYNKEVVWYFRNNTLYKNYKHHEKIISFYKENFENVKWHSEVLPVNETDTLYRLSFFVESN